MSKLCQGPSCHMYDTTDRKRGPKGNKVNQTRTVNRYGYGNNNFCTLNCQNDWWAEHGTRAVDHFGRLTEPKKLTEHNAWHKQYDWNSNHDMIYVYRNSITKEQRPLTEAQYRDSNYTINTGE